MDHSVTLHLALTAAHSAGFARDASVRRMDSCTSHVCRQFLTSMVARESLAKSTVDRLLQIRATSVKHEAREQAVIWMLEISTWHLRRMNCCDGQDSSPVMCRCSPESD
ncbi:hypothetical protein KIN20_027674 [Parelaphostrongylus tenuis]|uniref:Uncharacterized protein n=1 Tax=Parelaphostrongylus tenuis TaxID=148309 RepID=A0AAD5WE39_PARTN|nr:hypothetical protein KIN20_027674 [Parelaphostrongylus tenuis]